MAHVRSVEQQYSSLAQAHAARWGAEQTVRMAQEVVKKEQDELVSCRAACVDLVEAAQRLEQFQQELVKRTLDVVDNERRLRNILGLPAADNRRIAPVTPRIELHVVFDWETCLDEMMHHQPDITQQRVLTRLAELRYAIARYAGLPKLRLSLLSAPGQLLDMPEDMLLEYYQRLFEVSACPPVKTSKPGYTKAYVVSTDEMDFITWLIEQPAQKPPGTVRQALYAQSRSRAVKKQVVDQTRRRLTRLYPEVEAGYQQRTAATRSRVAAYQKLRSQQGCYNEGRITAERYLDAIAQFATALVAEHQYLVTYNITLAALSEGKGTLLTERNIVVARPARRTEAQQSE